MSKILTALSRLIIGKPTGGSIPTDGQFLKYVSANSRWEAADITATSDLIDSKKLSGTADVITLNGSGSGFATKDFLHLQAVFIASGTISVKLTFNNTTGTGYSWNLFDNFTTVDTNTGQPNIACVTTETDKIVFLDLLISNTTGSPHNITGSYTSSGNQTRNITGTWSTTDQITRIDLTNTQTGDYNTGSLTSLRGRNYNE